MKTRADMSETVAEVVRAAQEGDCNAQRQLYESLHQNIYRLMVRMVGRQDADDLVQQSFLQAFRKINQFTGQAQFGTWLHRLAVNEALQHLRRTKRAKTHVLEHEPTDGRPDHREQVLQNDLLEQALRLLEPDLRATFLLREIDGFAYGEIAETMQIPEGTVGSRLNRARRELKQHLLELGWGP
jgi:RNA polymerase sigma-70 factor (ECF subfamily)